MMISFLVLHTASWWRLARLLGSAFCLGLLLLSVAFAQSATDAEVNMSAEIPVFEAGARGAPGQISCSARGRPEYPRSALHDGVSAFIVLHIHIDKDGVVRNVEVKSNNVESERLRREFSSSAIAAARQFRCDSTGSRYILRQEFKYRVD